MFIQRSTEDRETVYVTLFGRRYLFSNGKYRGWMRK